MPGDAVRRYVDLQPGDPAPWFEQRGWQNPRYVFDTAAGRWLVLCFFASASDPVGREALAAALDRRDLFDDTHASFFGVTLDPGDETRGRIRDSMPGVRFILDFDGSVSRAYGAIPDDARPGGGRVPVQRFWFVIDPTLRIVAKIPFGADGAGHREAIEMIEGLPAPGRHAGIELQAPILMLPDVFEPALCEALVATYERIGGTPSGFMRQVDGRTVLVHEVQEAAVRPEEEHSGDAELTSPMPGSVVAVAVADGEPVEAGAVVVAVEAMKMEHSLRSPVAGVVELLVSLGDQVKVGQPLARIRVNTEGAS